MSRSAHPAGPRHADVLPEAHAGPAPEDVNALDPAIWPRDGTTGGRRAAHRWRRDHRAGRRARHSRAVPRRARPALAGAGLLDAPSTAWTSTTRARRSSAPPSRAGSPRKVWGWTSAPVASSPLPSPPGSPASASRCTATTSRAPSCSRPSTRSVGHVIVDSFDEIERLAALPTSAAARPRPGHGRRRGTHARVHRHRARGPEVRLLAARRLGGEGGGRRARLAEADLRRAALAHRLADLRDGRRSRSPRTAWSRSQPRSATRTASRWTRSTSAVASASRT